METKTCQFGTILDSSTRSTSCWSFLEINFRCGESPTLLTFKLLILTTPAKVVDNYLPLRFCRSFFGVCVPNITRKLDNKKTASRNNISIKFYIPQWTVENMRTNTMVTLYQKNAWHVFMLSSDQYNKAHKARFSTAGYEWTTWAKRNFCPAVRQVTSSDMVIPSLALFGFLMLYIFCDICSDMPTFLICILIGGFQIIIF